MIDRGDAVESTDGENHVVDHLDREVAARVVHVGNRAPNIRRGIVFLAAAHS